MELNTATLGDFVANMKILFSKGLDSVPQVMRKSGLFNVVPIDQHTGDTRDFSEIDLEEYADNKDESDQAGRAKVQQGYTVTMTAVRRAKDIGISYEMRTRNKYPEITRKLTALGKLITNRMELDLTHRLTFGTATSYTDKEGNTVDIAVGDDLQLFYTAHTIKTGNTTYRNILANNPRLSKGALEGMERLIVEETPNQFGEKMTDKNFDVLFTTDDPNTVNTAREYLKSTADVEGAHSGIENVYQSKYRHLIIPRLATDASGNVDTDKRYYWGLASTSSSEAHLGIWEEARMKNPSNLSTMGDVPLNSAEEFATDDINFGSRGGYGIVIWNGLWVKLSKGDGSS